MHANNHIIHFSSKSKIPGANIDNCLCESLMSFFQLNLKVIMSCSKTYLSKVWFQDISSQRLSGCGQFIWKWKLFNTMEYRTIQSANVFRLYEGTIN